MFVDAEGGIEILGYGMRPQVLPWTGKPRVQHGFVIMNATEIRL